MKERRFTSEVRFSPLVWLLFNILIAVFLILLLPNAMIVPKWTFVVIMLVLENGWIGAVLWASESYKRCKTCNTAELPGVIWKDGVLFFRDTGEPFFHCSRCRRNAGLADNWRPQKNSTTKLVEWIVAHWNTEDEEG
jgi:hypothetical protein